MDLQNGQSLPWVECTIGGYPHLISNPYVMSLKLELQPASILVLTTTVMIRSVYG